ncbi:MAG: TIGR02147 family protein [Bdellovibrionota bacterium]
MWQKVLQNALQESFDLGKERNPRYSLRAHAKKIGISSSALSEVLQGKRNLSRAKAREIMDRIAIPESKREHFRTLLCETSVSERKAKLPFQDLLLSDWLYLAVLHFFDLDIPAKSPSVIARRLSVPKEKVESVINTLLEAGLLIKNSQKKIERNSSQMKTSDGPSNESVRKFHRDGLALAQKALETQGSETRDFTSLIFVGDPDSLEEARKKIREAYQEVMIAVSGKKRTELYKMSVSLFPMRWEKT